MRFLVGLVLLVLALPSFYALTGTAYDIDGNDVTANVSRSDGSYASKSFLLAVANYWVNTTIDTTNYDPSNGNFTCEFSQTGLGILGNVYQEAWNGTGWQTVCSWLSITLPNSDTNYTCNVSAYVNTAGDTVLRCRAASLLAVTSTFRFDYMGLEGTRIALNQVQITAGETSRYEANQSAGNITTEGGNVTGLNLAVNASTDRWAGFYGNITGNLLLAQSADTQAMYRWVWNPSSGGVVCTSANSSLSVFAVLGADGNDIDTAWNFSSAATDSGANTFNGTNCRLDIGPATISDAGYADTGSPDGFITCALKQKDNPAKEDMLFCVNITHNGDLWNEEHGDYEMIVPTTYGSGTETYYFYMSLG